MVNTMNKKLPDMTNIVQSFFATLFDGGKYANK